VNEGIVNANQAAYQDVPPNITLPCGSQQGVFAAPILYHHCTGQLKHLAKSNHFWKSCRYGKAIVFL
jgi:hypothetical protein